MVEYKQLSFPDPLGQNKQVEDFPPAVGSNKENKTSEPENIPVKPTITRNPNSSFLNWMQKNGGLKNGQVAPMTTKDDF